MHLPFENSKDNFQLFISGKLIQEHLADGRIFILDDNGNHSRIVFSDVTIRMNNWNRVKSSMREDNFLFLT